MKTFKLTLSYDGSYFNGFQKQLDPKLVTIQGTLEDAFMQLYQQKIVVHGAGRTDAGVHARGQVAHVNLECSITADRLQYSLNRFLPNYLVVTSVEDVHNDFHARKWAVGKWYSYKIFHGKIPPAMGANYFSHVSQPMDYVLFEKSLRALEGTHCFKGFCGRGSSVKTYDRTIYLSKLTIDNPHSEWLTIHFVGDGFLRKMVRNMVGTCLEVAYGKRDLETIPLIFSSGDRKLAGRTAPANGLVLEKVFYDQNALMQSVAALS